VNTRSTQTASPIQVQHLTQGYGRREVLHDVSLTIPAGQTLALLGRNGAGKTTLIRTLLGLIAPRAGTVQILGLDPARDALSIRRKIGYLAEDQVMYGWMTAIEIGRFLAPFYPAWNDPHYGSLLTRFELPVDVKIKHFSKGQTVRLGLALALAHRPEAIILDDPALGLDPIARKEFNRDLIEHLQAEGRTVLYSSHLLSEVEAVADAVAILDRGRLIRTGRTEVLQREIKRVILPLDSMPRDDAPPGLLDVRRDGSRVAITVDGAEEWIRTLRAGGSEPTVEDLSLDEIFEAFVIGRRESWPGPTPRPLAAAS